MSTHARARAGVSRSWQSLKLIEDLPVLDNLRIASDVDRRWSVLSDLVWPRQGKPTAAMVRAIQVLQLGERLGDMPGDLGTGQRKLVALARAIATEPSILRMGVLLAEHAVHLVRRVSDRNRRARLREGDRRGRTERRALGSRRRRGIPPRRRRG